MPANKTALARYFVIDYLIRRASFRNERLRREDIVEYLREERQIDVHISTVEKDLYTMRCDTDLKMYAPIEYSKADSRYYYSEPYYDLVSALHEMYGGPVLADRCELCGQVSA